MSTPLSEYLVLVIEQFPVSDIVTFDVKRRNISSHRLEDK